jgi:hypothetical protein
MHRELSWRKKPQPITAWNGFPAIVDAQLPPDVAKLIDPSTGETLCEIQTKR